MFSQETEQVYAGIRHCICSYIGFRAAPRPRATLSNDAITTYNRGRTRSSRFRVSWSRVSCLIVALFAATCSTIIRVSSTDRSIYTFSVIDYNSFIKLLIKLRLRLMPKIRGCPKSVFLSQTCFLQQCTFVQTWNQVCEMFIWTEQNGSFVIRQNSIDQKMLCVYYFHYFIKQKKLFEPIYLIYLKFI